MSAPQNSQDRTSDTASRSDIVPAANVVSSVNTTNAGTLFEWPRTSGSAPERVIGRMREQFHAMFTDIRAAETRGEPVTNAEIAQHQADVWRAVDEACHGDDSLSDSADRLEMAVRTLIALGRAFAGMKKPVDLVIPLQSTTGESPDPCCGFLMSLPPIYCREVFNSARTCGQKEIRLDEVTRQERSSTVSRSRAGSGGSSARPSVEAMALINKITDLRRDHHCKLHLLSIVPTVVDWTAGYPLYVTDPSTHTGKRQRCGPRVSQCTKKILLDRYRYVPE